MENMEEFTLDSYQLNPEQKLQVELLMAAHNDVDRAEATLIYLYESGVISANELRQHWDGRDIRDVFSEDVFEEREDLIDEEFINQDFFE